MKSHKMYKHTHKGRYRENIIIFWWVQVHLLLIATINFNTASREWEKKTTSKEKVCYERGDKENGKIIFWWEWHGVRLNPVMVKFILFKLFLRTKTETKNQNRNKINFSKKYLYFLYFIQDYPTHMVKQFSLYKKKLIKKNLHNYI